MSSDNRKERSIDKPIAIVRDNARYQHCQKVLEKAKELNVEILFLPPYSHNLNIIERLWKFTKKKVMLRILNKDHKQQPRYDFITYFCTI